MLILASASPRRQELLRLITDDFTTLPSDVDEAVSGEIPLEKIPEYLALKKAAAVAAEKKDDVVLGCDTGVFLENRIIGKPKSEKAAVEILKMLSGKTHRVITGCALIKGNRVFSFSQTTQVEFYPLSSEQIEEYVATGEPMDKAGAYGIQGRGSLLVKGIHGDYFNVVGLPVAELSRRLKEFI